MVTFHVGSDGEAFGFYDTAMEIPWFREVVAQAEEYLASVRESMQSQWYREYRERND